MDMTSYVPGTPCWIDLGSPNIDESVAFYTGMFGWNVQDMGPEAGNYRMCSLGGKPVAGIGPLQMPGAPPAWTTYISVEDADATAGSVTQAGGQVLAPVMDVMGLGRMAVFMDAAGAVIAAWQPQAFAGSQLVNETGTVCWNELMTRGPEDSKAFYSAVFGWAPQVEDWNSGPYTVWVNDARPVAGMMPMDDSFDPEIPPYWLVYFAVDDTDVATAKAVELGGQVYVEPMDIPPGRFSVVADPHGAVMGIIKPVPM
jgi:predicted enzyme related to lactoylglutathione lyase